MPVLDGGLVMTVGGDDEQARLNVVRGRVFPGLDLSTDPRITPRLARREAIRLTQGQVKGRPRLVVLPRDAGKLAWEVNVFAAGQSDAGIQLSDGLYYLDAVSADLLEVRPTTAELAAPSVFSKLLSKASPQVSRRLTQMVLASLEAPKGQPVDVTGNAPYIGRVTAKGLRDNQGVSLIDTTTPSYNAASGRGGIYTFSADGSSSNSTLPGRPYTAELDRDQRPGRDRRPEGQPDRLRLLRRHRPQLLGRQGRVDGLDGQLQRRRLLQRLLQLRPGADGLRQPVRGPERRHGAGHPRRDRPRGHPRRHQLDRRAQLHRPVGCAQRVVLRLLRQRHRRPVLPARHGHPRRGRLRRASPARSRCAPPTPRARSRLATCSTATPCTTTSTSSTRRSAGPSPSAGSPTTAASTSTPRSGTTRCGPSAPSWPRSTTSRPTSPSWSATST